MPKLVVVARGAAPLEIAAAPGAALVDLCDENAAPVPFSCRSASCGTCRIDVLEGAELLSPPEDAELDILSLFGDDPGVRRLACQAKLRPGADAALAVVRVRAVDD
jgi:ferredoxin